MLNILVDVVQVSCTCTLLRTMHATPRCPAPTLLRTAHRNALHTTDFAPHCARALQPGSVTCASTKLQAIVLSLQPAPR